MFITDASMLLIKGFLLRLMVSCRFRQRFIITSTMYGVLKMVCRKVILVYQSATIVCLAILFCRCYRVYPALKRVPKIGPNLFSSIVQY